MIKKLTLSILLFFVSLPCFAYSAGIKCENCQIGAYINLPLGASNPDQPWYLNVFLFFIFSLFIISLYQQIRFNKMNLNEKPLKKISLILILLYSGGFYFLDYKIDQSATQDFNEYLKLHHITNFNTTHMKKKGHYLINSEHMVYYNNKIYYDVHLTNNNFFVNEIR